MAIDQEITCHMWLGSGNEQNQWLLVWVYAIWIERENSNIAGWHPIKSSIPKRIHSIDNSAFHPTIQHH